VRIGSHCVFDLPTKELYAMAKKAKKAKKKKAKKKK
jgi:hypothetical protein